MLALPQDALLEETPLFDPAEVAQRLDVTSFPNSITPRREPEKSSFADYGFTQVTREGDAVALQPENGRWVFRIRLLGATGDTLRICVLDRALDGGTYFTVAPIEIAEDDDGIFRATGREITSQECR
ncbi:hypothetical protein [Stakelama tenebrarum]|nr:hypothetical protein [Sphingosinithalassobacter tenebrarum]